MFREFKQYEYLFQKDDIPIQQGFVCSNCGPDVKPIIADDVYIVCPRCGEFEMRDVYTQGYALNPKNNAVGNFYLKRQCVYKRIVYFDILLNRLQGHGSFKVDKDTRQQIKERMNGEGNMADLKKVLKEMKLTKFYKCNFALLEILFNSIKAKISPYESNQLKQMFIDLQMPYEKYKTDDRYNFMCYTFVLKKLFHLLTPARDDLGSLLSLPKNIYLIYQHELIWANIADALGWANDFLFF